MRPAILLLALFACLLFAGCENALIEWDAQPAPAVCPSGTCPDAGTCPYKDVPPVDVPKALRQANYAGGSCNHASLITVLRWQGLEDPARKWRQNYAGGADVTDLADIADGLGLRFAYTNGGDAGFLEWCSRTRRGAAIHYYPGHAVTFLGYVGAQAVLVNNNDTTHLIHVPKTEFIAAWKGYGGKAITVVYSPAPPRPWI